MKNERPYFVPNFSGSILATFTKICVDKKEVPYFWYDVHEGSNFIVEQARLNPREIKSLDYEGNICTNLHSQIDTSMIASTICSWGLDGNPHEINPIIAEWYNYIPENKQRLFLSLGQKFYELFGCDEDGNIGRHSPLDRSYFLSRR